jgi:hypothetical protein
VRSTRCTHPRAVEILDSALPFQNVTDNEPCLLLGASRTLDGQCGPESNEAVYTSKKAAPLSTAGKLILACISDTCTLSVMASQSLCSLSSSGSLSRPSHEGGKLTIRFCIIDIPFLCIGGELRNAQQDVQVSGCARSSQI